MLGKLSENRQKNQASLRQNSSAARGKRNAEKERNIYQVVYLSKKKEKIRIVDCGQVVRTANESK